MLDLLAGYRTYLGAVGFLILAVYYTWSGDYGAAVFNLSGFMSVFGLARKAVALKTSLEAARLEVASGTLTTKHAVIQQGVETKATVLTSEAKIKAAVEEVKQ
jgi:hypothetical protein